MSAADVYKQPIACNHCGTSQPLNTEIAIEQVLTLTAHDGTLDGVDMSLHPTAQKLAARSLEFLKEVKDLCV